MDTLRPDERAAGVIAGADPYLELEQYLEKVHEEIGEVFDKWRTRGPPSPNSSPPLLIPSSTNSNSSTFTYRNISTTGNRPLGQVFDIPSPPTPSSRNASHYDEALLCSLKAAAAAAMWPPGAVRTLPRARTGPQDSWGDSLLAEFNGIIARELDALTAAAAEEDSPSSTRSASPSTVVQHSCVPGPTTFTDALSKLDKLSDEGKTDKLDRYNEEMNDTDDDDQQERGIPAQSPSTAKNGKVAVSLQSLLSRCCTDFTPTSSCTPPPTLQSIPFSASCPVDAGTQTSPALSRSSSFTWLSDSSLLFHDEHHSSSSVADESSSTTTSSSSSSMRPRGSTDDLDDSTEDSATDCGDNKSLSMNGASSSLIVSRSMAVKGSRLEDEVESGIGTASPPRSKASPKSSNNKVRRKEAWERLRRRPTCPYLLPDDVSRLETELWVRQESVETQTLATPPLPPPPVIETQDAISGVYGATSPSTSGVLSQTSLGRTRAKRPHCLPVKPLLPLGPASSSGSDGAATSPCDLGNKSSSAPLLAKQQTPTSESAPGGGLFNDGTGSTRVILQPRSHSERHLAEIEAAEACKWLRAAGFPQYAQMYEDQQFPIDIGGVQKDHPFLERDSFESLFRRLHALNRCAKLRVDSAPKPASAQVDDSDEDDACAISENWTFQPESRRWSRVGDVTASHAERLQQLSAAASRDDASTDSLSNPPQPPTVGLVAAALTAAAHAAAQAAAAAAVAQAEDEDAEDEEDRSRAADTVPGLNNFRYGSLPPGGLLTPGEHELLASRFRRSGSERLRDGAKAFLKRMESLKTRRRKRHSPRQAATGAQSTHEPVTISEPQVLDISSMQQRMKDLNCVDVGSSPDGSSVPLTPSPTTHPTLPPIAIIADNASGGHSSDEGAITPPNKSTPQHLPTPIRTRSKLSRLRRLSRPRASGEHGDVGALSDSECHPLAWRQQYLKDANSNHTSPKAAELLGRDDGDSPTHRQLTFRRESYVKQSTGGSGELGSQDSSSTLASAAGGDSDLEDIQTSPRQTRPVVRWHSFQRTVVSVIDPPLQPSPSSGSSFDMLSEESTVTPPPLAGLSCGQLLVLRKHALLRLTATMERYCPTHRTGWNWEFPKFIRKIKTPDYKDKRVFGVPLAVSLQRTGQSFPKGIEIALRWLRVTALDQVGLFRKSGVRSRIQRLKQLTESQGDAISYDGQQAYDVADMVKQYFRELPETLFTNKLSETFIAIFQHVPIAQRPEAVQCVLLLLPDEHREALHTLLDFLHQVASHAHTNQMTASNLAVCLAPSLFHLHQATPSTATSSPGGSIDICGGGSGGSGSGGGSHGSSRSASASPRRRKNQMGVPDAKELNENRAAHDCLLYLIREHKELFLASPEMLNQCHFGFMEESVPVGLELLGAEWQQDWRGYLHACTAALLKEAREKSRGWVNLSASALSSLASTGPDAAAVEVAYKKVGDGHPLRLWRVAVEIEAPPQELLQRVLRERQSWDDNMLKWRVAARLEQRVEVFQYVRHVVTPMPARDYCVIRSWRTDLPKGACAVVETSIEHPDAPLTAGAVRGIVLASRYLIEPCGSGRSRIMHLSRVDTKGRLPEWYNKSYGHVSALHLAKIRSTFRHQTTTGPESKV